MGRTHESGRPEKQSGAKRRRVVHGRGSVCAGDGDGGGVGGGGGGGGGGAIAQLLKYL